MLSQFVTEEGGFVCDGDFSSNWKACIDMHFTVFFLLGRYHLYRWNGRNIYIYIFLVCFVLINICVISSNRTITHWKSMWVWMSVNVCMSSNSHQKWSNSIEYYFFLFPSQCVWGISLSTSIRFSKMIFLRSYTFLF